MIAVGALDYKHTYHLQQDSSSTLKTSSNSDTETFQLLYAIFYQALEDRSIQLCPIFSDLIYFIERNNVFYVSLSQSNLTSLIFTFLDNRQQFPPRIIQVSLDFISYLSQFPQFLRERVDDLLHFFDLSPCDPLLFALHAVLKCELFDHDFKVNLVQWLTSKIEEINNKCSPILITQFIHISIEFYGQFTTIEYLIFEPSCLSYIGYLLKHFLISNVKSFLSFAGNAVEIYLKVEPDLDISFVKFLLLLERYCPEISHLYNFGKILIFKDELMDLSVEDLFMSIYLDLDVHEKGKTLNLLCFMITLRPDQLSIKLLDFIYDELMDECPYDISLFLTAILENTKSLPSDVLEFCAVSLEEIKHHIDHVKY